MRYPVVEALTALADRRLRACASASRPRRRSLRSSARCSSRSRPSTSSIASSRTGSCCRASAVVLVAQTAIAAEPRMGARRRRRFRVPARRGARLPEGDGHGRRQARAPPRRDARPQGRRRAHAGPAVRARPGRRSWRSGTGRAHARWRSPFAPFLALGALVALFAGEPILDWYLGSSADRAVRTP